MKINGGLGYTCDSALVITNAPPRSRTRKLFPNHANGTWGFGIAIHSITQPPYFARTTVSPFSDSMIVWGGQTRQHAIAQEDAWSRTLQFLKAALTENFSRTQARLWLIFWITNGLQTPEAWDQVTFYWSESTRTPGQEPNNFFASTWYIMLVW